ncbi:glycoside hydrolase family 36 N-terminal domain-containing protein [Streptomyces sp. KL2]|uniref:glycoside hydrolase family 36 N-terminal domain-containing protein n=1 Tax=Streptomyces sp. KL2 TaxID=3050126 RepID=UPI00397AEB7C
MPARSASRPSHGGVGIDEAGGTVVLRTPASCYVLRVDTAAGTVCHVRWGAPVPLADAAALPVWADHDDSFAGRLDGVEEYPIEGGARFGVPALQVRFADGSDPVEPRVEDCRIVAEGHVAVSLRDRSRPLAWEPHYRTPPGTDMLERWTEITHTAGPGAEPLLLLRCASAHWPLPQRPDWRLSWSTAAGSRRTGWSGPRWPSGSARPWPASWASGATWRAGTPRRPPRPPAWSGCTRTSARWCSTAADTGCSRRGRGL